VPLPGLGVLCIGCVVAAVKSSTVVGDCIAVIYSSGDTVCVPAKVEASEREGDCRAQFLFEPVSLRESFQVDH